MQRYFASLEGKFARLSESDRHHLLDVMRSEKGEAIEIVSGGVVYPATIAEISPLSIRVGEPLKNESELPSSLILAFALLKHGNDDWVLEKGTELGAAAFAPFISSRTIIRLDDEDEKKKKHEREMKIVQAAAEQSKRTLIPKVEPIGTYEDILSLPADLKLFAYEAVKEDVASLEQALTDVTPGASCLVVIGPEGGFSPEEAAEAKEKGFRFVSLGRRILRAETAAIYCASVFGYVIEARGA
jgi:16S rRNA (uracil1498-N3)-methyltransferase